VTESKTWLITGSSRGLGRASARAAARSRSSRRRDSPQSAPTQRSCQQVRRPGAGSCAGCYERSDRPGTLSRRQLRRLAAWMCLSTTPAMAMYAPWKTPRSPSFRAQIETNLFGVIIMTKAALPYFRERTRRAHHPDTSIAGRIGPSGAHRTQRQSWRRGLLGITATKKWDLWA